KNILWLLLLLPMPTNPITLKVKGRVSTGVWLERLRQATQRKQKTLANFTGTSANLEEINEVKKVNQIFANFCKQEIGGKDINEIRTKLNGRQLTEILEENET
ncbi:5781_t:CDS:2, partial [Funneliformis geosporum]